MSRYKKADVLAMVDDAERLRKRAARVDTSVLFERLRRKAAEKGFSVYNIYVRNAGVGIAYTDVQNRAPMPGEVTVYAYRKNLREAIEYELKALSGSGSQMVA